VSNVVGIECATHWNAVAVDDGKRRIGDGRVAEQLGVAPPGNGSNS